MDYLEAQALSLNSKKKRTISIGGDRIASLYLATTDVASPTRALDLISQFSDLKILNPDLVQNCFSVVDIPFESVQEIALKLACDKELFKYHCTEKDEGYRQTMQRPPRYVSDIRG